MINVRRLTTSLFLALFLAAGLWPNLAPAQTFTPTGDTGQTAGDPPERVGRISFLSGIVSWRETEDEDWAAATLNYPVTSGNAFWTEPGARAELRVGGDSIRLDSGTELVIDQLDGLVTKVTVPQGIINMHIESRDPNEIYRVVTPRGDVDLLAPGTYRIDAGTEALPTAVAVLRGSARFVSETAATVVAGETVLASGDPVTLYVQRTMPSEFDDWSLARDNYEKPREVVRYVSPEMTGYEDLGAYGDWQTVPEYGPVWIPAAVPVGWAPYRFGHWAWIRPWGWTWIDDARWGFAPFHYGRWFFFNNRWCWWPGKRVHRPVYSPALVVFVGGGDFHVTVGARRRPAVGWIPLAPHEIYEPHFRASRKFKHDVNINIVKDDRRLSHEIDLADRRARQNVNRLNLFNQRFTTVVPRDDFEERRDVARTALPVPRQEAESAPVAAEDALPARQVRPRGGEGAARAPGPTTTRRFEGRPGKQLPGPDRERQAAPVTPAVTAPARQPRETGSSQRLQENLLPGAPSRRIRKMDTERRPAAPVTSGTQAAPARPAPGPRPVAREPIQTPAEQRQLDRRNEEKRQEQRQGRRETGTPQPRPEERQETATPQQPSEPRRTLEAPRPRPVERREPAAPQAQPSGRREVTAPQPRPVERRETVTPQQQIIDRGGGAPAQRPVIREREPREIAVPRPPQSTVLTPSEEGWVRQPGRTPAAKEQPRAREQKQPAANAPQREEGGNGNRKGRDPAPEQSRNQPKEQR
ncbi:MAG: hypothetical protein PHY92_01800 [Alphaproteobacteria bacterium]|nr:hypothetical protein [Alphaproteobacteria bacterium]